MMSPIQRQLTNGRFLHLEVLADHTFRLRIAGDDVFAEPSLNRYEILRGNWPACSCEIQEKDNRLHLKTTQANLAVSLQDGRFSLTKPDESPLSGSIGAPQVGDTGGFNIHLSLQDGERLYGLGDVTRDRIQMRGMKTEMWLQDVTGYIPIPWLMSSNGWGLLVNTTWRHHIDAGYTDSKVLSIDSAQGNLDIYLFVGNSLPELLDHYTYVSGRPALLPEWAYGFTFVCNEQATARDMLADGLHFRENHLPCDVIGLEPGWMEENYDLSLAKNWHHERFFIPSYGLQGPDSFLAVARRMGFKISMWMCCDYDLLYEAERRAVATEENALGKREKEFHSDAYEQDEHLTLERWMDNITNIQEPWFKHLEKFVDQGISAFKLDGAFYVCEHPDRLWGAALPGGAMTDEQMHNLYPLLYNQQMAVGYKEHTKGLRPMVYSAGGYTGIQQFSATWSGDTGGGPKPLVSLLNHGLSGHSNTTVDMHIFSPEGIHFGFLQPWSQLNSWAYWRHPWLLGDELGPIFKFYAQFRSRLIPYIYSMAHVAANTGMPILRAMPLHFPEDAVADSLLKQYMLGDAFLVGAFEESFHLPAGKWIDFWTGERYEGEQDFTYERPAQRGGPLFLREGAIVPLGPVMDYWGQKPLDEIEMHVFPSEYSQFTLTEDDGTTIDYLDGKISRTVFTCKKSEGKVVLEIGAPAGDYSAIPQVRDYTIHFYLDETPQEVVINGEKIVTAEWDDLRKIHTVKWK